PILLLISVLIQRKHGNGFLRSRTHIGAASAACAVQDSSLNTEAVILHALALCGNGNEPFGSLGSFLLRCQEGTDGSMWADIGTQVALATFLAVPNRHVDRDPSLLVLRSAVWHSSIGKVCKVADRDVVSLHLVSRDLELADPLRQ